MHAHHNRCSADSVERHLTDVHKLPSAASPRNPDAESEAALGQLHALVRLAIPNQRYPKVRQALAPDSPTSGSAAGDGRRRVRGAPARPVRQPMGLGAGRTHRSPVPVSSDFMAGATCELAATASGPHPPQPLFHRLGRAPSNDLRMTCKARRYT